MTDSADGLRETERDDCWTMTCLNTPTVRVYDRADEEGLTATACEMCAEAMVEADWSHYSPL